MDTKQKTLLILTISIFAYLGYQIYGFIKKDMSNPPRSAGNAKARVAMVNAATPSRRLSSVTEQKVYLQTLNHYKLAKMKHQFLAEKAVIAATQHHTVIPNQPAPIIEWSTMLNNSTELANYIKMISTPLSTATLHSVHHPSTHYTVDEHRILAIPKKAYTIQLIASYHRHIIENFAIANDLSSRATPFYVIHHGKRHYILLYGNYSTYQKAKQALKNLPPNLTPEAPWIRSISTIQRNIRHHLRSHTV